MTAESPPSSADQLREELSAETILARMEMFEDTAALYETETIPKTRQRFAQRYFEHVGIEPELRHALRPILEGIKAGGGGPVRDAIAALRSRYSKGLGGGAEDDSRARS